MILRNNPKAALKIGMAALLLASVLNVLSRWVHGFAGDAVDGGMGLMYGIAIGLLLLSVRREAFR